MANKSDIDAMNLYLSIMQEVKIRAYSINTATNFPNNLPSPLIREYCYLQLRMLCELVALGCLVAHGDIEQTKTKSFQKAYKADEILKKLEDLHPDFFPVPVNPVINSNSIHIDKIEGGSLTKTELIKLYGKCGDVLHRGNLRSLIPAKPPIETGYSDINEWGQKMLNLLSNHRITRIGGKFHFLTFLEVLEQSGNVQVAIAESPANA